MEVMTVRVDEKTRKGLAGVIRGSFFVIKGEY
jgi:hypothetical protein